MKLYHATPITNLASIKAQGLRVACTHPAAKIKGVWLASSSNRPWGVLHTLRKHGVSLEDVVVIEVNVPRSHLTRFRQGFWFSKTDITPDHLGIVIPGTAFGVGVSD